MPIIPVFYIIIFIPIYVDKVTPGKICNFIFMPITVIMVYILVVFMIMLSHSNSFSDGHNLCIIPLTGTVPHVSTTGNLSSFGFFLEI